MISDHTRSAVIALMAVDPDATDAERRAVANAMAGRRPTQNAVVRIGEAARRIGRHYNTVRKLVKAHRLTPVYGTGRTVIGISENSLEDFINGENGKQQ